MDIIDNEPVNPCHLHSICVELLLALANSSPENTICPGHCLVSEIPKQENCWMGLTAHLKMELTAHLKNNTRVYAQAGLHTYLRYSTHTPTHTPTHTHTHTRAHTHRKPDTQSLVTTSADNLLSRRTS